MSASHISKEPETQNKKLENIKAAGENDCRKMLRVTEERRGTTESFLSWRAKVVKVRLRRIA